MKSMTTGRLEAFSDGVIAIILTIMVLELKTPEDGALESLAATVPTFLAYVLSFIYVGVYWNNHHHMLATAERVNGAILWANLHLLFWLSLVPFTTHWMGEHSAAAWPSVVYGFVLACAGLAYLLLQMAIIAEHGGHSLLKQAVGRDAKGYASLALYIVGIGLAFAHPRLAQAVYALVAVIWFIPDRRIERLTQH